MLKEDFHLGPFTIRPSGRMQVVGETQQLFDIDYGDETMRERVPVKPGSQKEVAEQIEESTWGITAELRKEHECAHRIDLVDGHGERLASFQAADSVTPGMTPGLVDDRFPHWLRSADRLYSQAVTMDEYARLRAEHERPRYAWIADLLDQDILTTHVEDWRPPTAWEIRHLVGATSFTSISGARAAELVGVTAANFRKYTAREGAKNRQNMGFAMWHLLLHRLEVQRMPEGLS